MWSSTGETFRTAPHQEFSRRRNLAGACAWRWLSRARRYSWSSGR